MIQPMPIFIPSPAPATCPHCGKPEDIIEVCAHCKYEYPESEDFPGGFFGFCGIAFVAAMIAVGVATLWTFMDWITGYDTLAHIVTLEWRWFLELLGRIW